MPKVSRLGLLEPAGRRFGGGAWGAFGEKCVPDGRPPVGWAPPGHPRPARRHPAHCCTWRREAPEGVCAKKVHGARGRQCARAPGHAAHFHDGRDESVPAMCRASSLPCYSAWACPSPPGGRHAAGVCCDAWQKKKLEHGQLEGRGRIPNENIWEKSGSDAASSSLQLSIPQELWKLCVWCVLLAGHCRPCRRVLHFTVSGGFNSIFGKSKFLLRANFHPAECWGEGEGSE